MLFLSNIFNRNFKVFTMRLGSNFAAIWAVFKGLFISGVSGSQSEKHQRTILKRWKNKQQTSRKIFAFSCFRLVWTDPKAIQKIHGIFFLEEESTIRTPYLLILDCVSCRIKKNHNQNLQNNFLFSRKTKSLICPRTMVDPVDWCIVQWLVKSVGHFALILQWLAIC